ncbi:hypothetical protein GUJ93_ZPchr0001g31721 [Zizania palustris]|uniref:Uncharacterized protein n=1 Tax=Zizania palustris TaxID=103762 RepID=A0A8J5VBS9_ZIZPA|nr:hypothetical protein GUJ93_ZPchr0001g31721 [Zizania palustris]
MGGDADADADAAAAQREAIKDQGEDAGRGLPGVRTLLLETIQINPRLDGAFEMLSVLEVLCAAGEAPHGRRVDWYKILQVLPGTTLPGSTHSTEASCVTSSRSGATCPVRRSITSCTIQASTSPPENI